MKKAPRWACGKHTWACNVDKTHTPVLNRCACGPGGGGINAVFSCRERTDSENGSVDFLSSSSSSTQAAELRGAPSLSGSLIFESQNTCCLPSDRRGVREKRRGVCGGGGCAAVKPPRGWVWQPREERRGLQRKIQRDRVRRYHVKQEWSKMQQRRGDGTSSRRHRRLTSTRNLFSSLAERLMPLRRRA